VSLVTEPTQPHIVFPDGLTPTQPGAAIRRAIADGERHDCVLCGCQTITDATDLVLFVVGYERERQETLFPQQRLRHSALLGSVVGAQLPQVDLKDAQAREARAKERVAYNLRHERLTWADVLNEEVAEALAATSVAHLREELVQVAAVAVRWIEAIDRGDDV
jgi:hypothetical protein